MSTKPYHYDHQRAALLIFPIMPHEGSDEAILLQELKHWTKENKDGITFYRASTNSMTIFMWYKPGVRMEYEFILNDLAKIRLQVGGMKGPQGTNYSVSRDEIKHLQAGDTGTILIKALKQLGLWRPFFRNS